MQMDKVVTFLRYLGYGNKQPNIQIDFPSHVDFTAAFSGLENVECGSVMDWPGFVVTFSHSGISNFAPVKTGQDSLNIDWSFRTCAMVEMKAIVLRTFADEPCVVVAANCLDDQQHAAFFGFWGMVANIAPFGGATSGHYLVRFKGATESHLLATLPANFKSIPADAASKLVVAIECGAKPTHVRVIIRTHMAEPLQADLKSVA